MEYILVLLIVALLNGAIAYIDGLMEGIIPLTLYAEQYMSTLAGVDLFQSLFDIVFGFGVSLIVLKFLKKGFETYVLWSDGDADEEPIAILTNFFKAMAVAICFPTMYDWLATIVEEMSNKMLEAIGLATAYDWAGWVSGISTMGLVTAIFGLVFVIVYFILYFQFLMRGLEILILRVGIPLACVGLIDNDKGVFKPYMSKFFQSALSVVIQVSLAKLGVGLMMNMHIFWGVACMILAVRTPKFLQDFLITTGGGGGGAIVNNAYHSVRPVSYTHLGDVYKRQLYGWCRWSRAWESEVMADGDNGRYFKCHHPACACWCGRPFHLLPGAFDRSRGTSSAV